MPVFIRMPAGGHRNIRNAKTLPIDNVRTMEYYAIMNFNFNAEKNELLFKTRGITFNQVIEAIEQGAVLLDFSHPNQKKYPNQMVMVIRMNDYTYCVPYVIDGEEFFLKTVFPNRNFSYLIDEEGKDA